MYVVKFGLIIYLMFSPHYLNINKSLKLFLWTLLIIYSNYNIIIRVITLDHEIHVYILIYTVYIYIYIYTMYIIIYMYKGDHFENNNIICIIIILFKHLHY